MAANIGEDEPSGPEFIGDVDPPQRIHLPSGHPAQEVLDPSHQAAFLSETS